MAALVALGLAGCASTSTERPSHDCLERGPPVLLFQTLQDASSRLSVDGNAIAAQGHSSFRVFYGGDPSFEFGLISFAFNDGNVDHSLSADVATAKELLTSRQGQHFSTARVGAVSIRTFERSICEAGPVLALETDVLQAVGQIDFGTHEIDRNFTRTFKITVAWGSIGCDIDPFAATQEFTIDAQNVQFGCDGLFHFRETDSGL